MHAGTFVTCGLGEVAPAEQQVPTVKVNTSGSRERVGPCGNDGQSQTYNSVPTDVNDNGGTRRTCIEDARWSKARSIAVLSESISASIFWAWVFLLLES